MYGCRTTMYRQEDVPAGPDLGLEIELRTAALDADDGDVFGNDVEDPSSAPAVSLEALRGDKDRGSRGGRPVNFDGSDRTSPFGPTAVVGRVG
jgi:hypothetical protein